LHQTINRTRAAALLPRVASGPGFGFHLGRRRPARCALPISQVSGRRRRRTAARLKRPAPKQRDRRRLGHCGRKLGDHHLAVDGLEIRDQDLVDPRVEGAATTGGTSNYIAAGAAPAAAVAATTAPPPPGFFGYRLADGLSGLY
jgi:hypothetical protein